MPLVRHAVIGLLAGFAFSACALYADEGPAPPQDETDAVEQAVQPDDPCAAVRCVLGYHCVARGHKAVCLMDKRPKAK
jgi:hypothetical protein